MHPFQDLDGVHETLDDLIGRGLAARLERRPGQKEERYAQLLEDPDAAGSGGGAPATQGAGLGHPGVSAATQGAGPEHPSSFYPPARAADPVTGDPGREALAELSERVERLEREIAELRAARGADEPAGVPR
jgi:uncharacterized protein YceH (UPF0502 family)